MDMDTGSLLNRCSVDIKRMLNTAKLKTASVHVRTQSKLDNIHTPGNALTCLLVTWSILDLLRGVLVAFWSSFES